MNELYFDLIRRYPRNIFRITMGILLLAAVGYFLIKQDQFFSTTHLVIFTFGGLYYLLMGLGINPITVWGKAFIKVNQSVIEIKPSMFAKAITYSWSNIKEVQIKVTGIRLLLDAGDAHEMEYQKMDEESIKELKQTIVAISKEKGIKLG